MAIPLGTFESVLLRLKGDLASRRTGAVCLPLPVLITVDDCGFARVYPNNPQTPLVSLETYHCLLKLARKYDTRLVLAFTTSYLEGDKLPFLNDLMAFVGQNQKYLEIADHGWIHDQPGHAGEFYLLDENRPVPAKVQEESVRQSRRIYARWGLDFPRVFTPPYNAFVPGVTDDILSRYGCRYIVSAPVLEDNKYSPVRLDYHSRMSANDGGVMLLPRSWIGVLAIETSLGDAALRKSKQELLQGCLKGVAANPARMTHIGNFLPQNYPFWDSVLGYVAKSPFLYLPRDVAQAAAQWLFLRHGSWRLEKRGNRVSLRLDKSVAAPYHQQLIDKLVIKVKGTVAAAFLGDDRLKPHRREDFAYLEVPFENAVAEVVFTYEH